MRLIFKASQGVMMTVAGNLKETLSIIWEILNVGQLTSNAGQQYLTAKVLCMIQRRTDKHISPNANSDNEYER